MSIRHIYKLICPVTRYILPNRLTAARISSIYCSTFTSESTQQGEPPKKKKTVIIPKITLIQGDNLSVTTLDEAQKLSKRRDLKLVKVTDLDTKTQRPVYKLMTGSDYYAEDLKQRLLKKEKKQSELKGEKVIFINYKIGEHDLQSNIRKMQKWLNKMYEVRIIINGDSSNTEKAESVYSFIEKSMDKDFKIVQKKLKGSDIKFQILPSVKNKIDSPL